MEIVCWIINKLMSIVSSTHDVINNLQDIYFSTLKACLEHIPAERSWYKLEVDLNCIAIDFSSETDSATHNNSLQMVLHLLSKVDVDADSQVEFLKIFCPMLSKSHHIKDIELALYSRKNEKLLSEWLLLCNKTHACLTSVTTLLTAYKISEDIFKLIENSKISLYKQELLKRTCVRKLHWLNDILVSFVVF